MKEALHLHWGWNDPASVKRDPLHTISIGIAVCGAQKLPRGTFFNDPEMVTCQACLSKMKEQPAPPIAKHLPAPTPNNKPVPTANGVIVALTKRNPRKPGTAKHERMALLLKHAGQSVEAFASAGGNLETLKNAIKENIVEVKLKATEPFRQEAK